MEGNGHAHMRGYDEDELGGSMNDLLDDFDHNMMDEANV
jgi:hypothetical protein